MVVVSIACEVVDACPIVFSRCTAVWVLDILVRRLVFPFFFWWCVVDGSAAYRYIIYCRCNVLLLSPAIIVSYKIGREMPMYWGEKAVGGVGTLSQIGKSVVAPHHGEARSERRARRALCLKRLHVCVCFGDNVQMLGKFVTELFVLESCTLNDVRIMSGGKVFVVSVCVRLFFSENVLVTNLILVVLGSWTLDPERRT